MADNRRVYVVHHKHSKTSRLVRAANQSQAIRHATEEDYDCKVASQDDCIRLVAEGVKVENAGGAA
jgi:hypothetical protein